MGTVRLVSIALAALGLAVAVSTSSWLATPSAAAARPMPTVLPTTMPPGPVDLP